MRKIQIQNLKNNKSIILVLGITLIVSIVAITTFSKNFFDNRKPKVKNELKVKRGGDQQLNLTEQTPVSDKSVDSIAPYSFEINNKGNTKELYDIMFEDFVSDDGKEPLGRAVLKYQLKSENKIIKEGNLIDVQENVIAKEEIAPKTNKKYELRIWVDEKVPASEWVGKSYSYNVYVEQINK